MPSSFGKLTYEILNRQKSKIYDNGYPLNQFKMSLHWMLMKEAILLLIMFTRLL